MTQQQCDTDSEITPEYALELWRPAWFTTELKFKNMYWSLHTQHDKFIEQSKQEHEALIQQSKQEHELLIAQYKKNYDDLYCKYKNQRKAFAPLKLKYDEMKKNYEHSQSQIEKYVHLLQEQHKNYQILSETTENNTFEYRNEIESLRKQLETLKHSHESQRCQSERQRNTIKKLNDTKTNLLSQINDLKSQLEKQKQTFNKTNLQYKTLEQQVETLTKELSKLQNNHTTKEEIPNQYNQYDTIDKFDYKPYLDNNGFQSMDQPSQFLYMQFQFMSLTQKMSLCIDKVSKYYEPMVENTKILELKDETSDIVYLSAEQLTFYLTKHCKLMYERLNQQRQNDFWFFLKHMTQMISPETKELLEQLTHIYLNSNANI